MTARTKPLVVYLVAEDWYFLSHRLPMACAARDAGYDVHVATHLNAPAAAIEVHGFKVHALDWRRGSLNPLNLIGIVKQVRRLYRALKPDLVHHVALQPSVIGSIAATGLPVVRLNALAGLGFGFTSDTLKARLIRPILSTLLRLLFRRPSSAVLVQNADDRALMVALGIPLRQVSMVKGSGVDTQAIQLLPEPPEPIMAAFVGRLLDDKGIRTLISAHEILVGRGEGVRLLIAGDADPANPTSIAENEIARWQTLPGVELLGFVDDVASVWARAHIAVLPSRREGLPKSLLEAAAFGRPIVATDVPGCREIARDGVNALLVPLDDAAALADAIVRLARDAPMRARFSVAGRELVEREFSSARVGQEVVAVYDRLLNRDARLLPQAGARG